MYFEILRIFLANILDMILAKENVYSKFYLEFFFSQTNDVFDVFKYVYKYEKANSVTNLILKKQPNIPALELI